MRQCALPIAILAALALAGCASKPKPSLAEAASNTQPPVTSGGAEPTRAPVSGGIQPGSQEDLAATAGDRVLFAVDSFDLTPEARETLRRQAAWLARYPAVKVIVSGNADERGTREYNLALGARRAEQARQFLVAAGVAGGRLQTISYGKERPVDPRSTEEAWAANRNAHTVLLDAVGRGW